jgi:hypothetical protein
MGKQYFLGLEAVFKGSGNPAYPGEPLQRRLHASCTLTASGDGCSGAGCTVEVQLVLCSFLSLLAATEPGMAGGLGKRQRDWQLWCALCMQFAA